MKKILFAALASLILSSQFALAAQTADVRMYCVSIRFSRGVGPFNLFSMDLSGVPSGINGELYPIGGPTSHYSNLTLTDESDDEIPGYMYLNVPVTDNNGNGFEDIYETDLAFSGGSSGSYSFPGYNGSVSATWSRNAGSYAGTCQLNFQFLGTFTHTFNVLEYKGPLTYTPGSNTVSGTVDLTLTGIPSYKLQGPVTFTKSAEDPHNELMRESGTWTNLSLESFPFFNDALYRDTFLETNYYGLFRFFDWFLDTPERDYYFWVLSIDDHNDADSDGIPDLSDDPQTISVRSPILGIKNTSTNVLLTISANVGQVCEIQQASTVNAVSWPTISSVTLTNDPQTISLPLPVGATAFWRVRTP